MKRLPGDETSLLRLVLDRADAALKYYNLRLSYSVDVDDNSYTVQVLPEGLDHVGVLMRLERHDRLLSILEDIVSASEDVGGEHAIQRARCELDSRPTAGGVASRDPTSRTTVASTRRLLSPPSSQPASIARAACSNKTVMPRKSLVIPPMGDDTSPSKASPSRHKLLEEGVFLLVRS